MSSVACVWTDFGDDEDANQWYADSHIPAVVEKLGMTAKHAGKAEEDIFKEVPGIHGAFMTVYNLPGGLSTEELETQIRPGIDQLPKDARLNTRVYTKFASWLGQEWVGDDRDVQMWVVVRWQPVEAVHDQFLEYFTNEFAPGMLKSPELLRTRVYKVDNVSSLADQKYAAKDVKSLFQYLTFWEFDCDELPWEILVYLGSSERWRHYVEGGHVSWQIAQYMVNKAYPDDDDEGTDSVSSKRTSTTPNSPAPGESKESDSDDTSARESDDDDDNNNNNNESHNPEKRASDGDTHGEPYTVR